MKNTTPVATAVAVSLTLIGSTLCHAQDESTLINQFNRFDTDKNGSISLAEYQSKSRTPEIADKRFEKLDTDFSGSLSFEEFSASKPKKPRQEKPAADSQK